VQGAPPRGRRNRPQGHRNIQARRDWRCDALQIEEGEFTYLDGWALPLHGSKPAGIARHRAGGKWGIG